MTPLNILFLVPNNDIGGHTKFILNLAKFLDSRRYSCSFHVPCFTHYTYTKKFRAVGSPLKRIFIWLRYFLGQIRAEFTLRRFRWRGQRLAIGSPDVTRYLFTPRKQIVSRADIIVVLSHYQVEELENLGFEKKRIILVIHHLEDHDRNKPNEELLSPEFRIVVSSNRTARECDAIGIRTDSLCELGVDIDLYSPRQPLYALERKLKLGFFYYQHPRKNPKLTEYLVNFYQSKNQAPEIHVYGNGFPLKDEGFHIHENLDEEEYAKSISDLDIFIYISNLEGFGLPPLEAMSCGVPVVATNVGAVREFLHDGKEGFLIEPGSSASEYIKRIDFLMENPISAELMGRRGRKTAENWSWRSTCHRYMAIFDAINKTV